MGAQSEILARQFEGKIRDALATLERLSDGHWQKVTEGERWPVGVTAHHMASVLEPISRMITTVASGQPMPSAVSLAMVDAMNARHAKDYAECTKAETIHLLQRSAAVAAGVIRGLSAEQLVCRGVVLTDAPPMSAEELVTGGLLGHLDQHFGSIRRTAGHAA